MKRLSTILALTIIAPLMQGCGDIHVSPLKAVDYSSLSTQGEICTDLPAELGLTTKILFVVDKSGSNMQTDPNNLLRADSMRNLISLYAGNPRVYYGLIEFHDGGASALIKAEDNGPKFTNDSNEALAAVSAFVALPDLQATPYVAALGLTKQVIQSDIEAGKEELATNYNIIFISDGVPMPVQNNRDSDIYALVSSIANLSRSNIHFSSVYYGPTNQEAESRLQNMADLGGGIYKKAIQGVTLDLSRFILTTQSSEPYLIKKFVIYNMNAGMCDDGTVGADSDADGICDKDELRYNQLFQNDKVRLARMKGKTFDPTNRNSFDPHISDALYYRYIVYNEALPLGCTDEDDADDDMDMLSNCEERFIFNQSPQGPTASWTAKMNQRGKQGDSTYFDTDGDGILDSLELFFFKNKSAPLNYNNLQDRINGYDQEQLLINHLNPLKPRSETAYNGVFTKVDPDSEGRNCYSYEQPNLPLYKTHAVAPAQTSGNFNLSHDENENVILIYFIEAPEYAPNSKGFLRYSFQKMKKDINGPKDLNLDTKLFDIFPR